MALMLHLGVVSCNEPKDFQTGSEYSLNGYSFTILPDSKIDQIDSGVTGTGKIVFTQPLGEVSSSRNIKITLEIPELTFAELRLYSDKNLERGILIRISRLQNVVRIGSITSDNFTNKSIQLEETAAKSISLAIDVHNNETPAHVLAWPASSAAVTDDNALFNSDADSEMTGNGASNFWGMVLGGAKITNLELNDALLSH